MSGAKLFSLISNTTQTRFVNLATILWFGLVFNIERLNIAGVTPVNFSNAMYIMIALVGVALLAFPDLEKLNPLHSSIALLTLYSLTIAVLGLWSRYGSEPIISVLEIIILIISYLLLRRLAHLLLDLELGLQFFGLQAEHASIVSVAQGKARVEQELNRAIQYDRRVACVYCEVYDPNDSDLEPVKLDGDIQKHIEFRLKQHYQHGQLGRNITYLTYKSDIIIAYRNGYLIFLPETGEAELTKFLSELAFLVKTNLQLNFLVGEAFFPNDGADFDTLVREARSNLRVFLGSESEEAKTREGDVYVGIEQRLTIERNSEWVNKLPYQSQSARMIYRPVKRLMDIAFCILATPLLLPVMAAIALLIYLDDHGPIFYLSERTGFGGRRFKMYKFRTMKVNAPALPPEIIETDDGQIRYVWPDKDDDDPRITRVGRILRKTSLDEIPQILNVLKGDMSFVGPRPTTWHVDMYTLLQTERLSVRPGITGLWQVSARDTMNFDERLLWDLKYVEKMGLWLDFQILWRTVAQVIHRKGA